MSSSSEPQEQSPRKTYRLMAGMAITAILLLGIVIYSLSQLNSTASNNIPLKDPILTPTLRQDLPHFEYSQDGKSLSPQNFEGHWTLLSFWAFWCGPCLEEMPQLDRLSQQWQGPAFEIVTVNVDPVNSENAESAAKFLADEEISLPTLFDKTGALKNAFSVNDLPQHFLISPEAKIIWQAKGAFRWGENVARDQLMKIMETAESDKETDGESSGLSGPSSAPGPNGPSSPKVEPAPASPPESLPASTPESAK